MSSQPITVFEREFIARIRQVAAAREVDLTGVSDERIMIEANSVDISDQRFSDRSLMQIALRATEPIDPDAARLSPQQVIRQHADQMTYRISATPAERTATYRVPDALDDHETRHRVTFVPIPNDLIARLREATQVPVTDGSNALVLALSGLVQDLSDCLERA